MSWIPKSDLKENGIYRLKSRNLGIGIWHAAHGFYGPRWKFGPDPFLTYENHWDDGPPHGTAKPMEFIMMMPEKATDSEILGVLTYLLNKKPETT